MESQHRYQPKGLNKLQPGRTLGNVPEPGETGQVGHTWGCTLLECLGKDHSVPAQHRAAVAGPACCPQPCSAPARHHLPPVWDQPAAVQAPQESNSSSNSAHVPPYSKAVRQTRPAPPTHPRQPPSHYLFKCSSRKRKVMRLGSGSERRRCIMQFSLAAGSERAGSKEGEGSGQGLVQQQDPPWPDTSCQPVCEHWGAAP